MTRREKMRIALALIAGGLVAAATPVLASILCDQGAGSATAAEWNVNISGRRAGVTTEVTVTNAAGGTTVPATPLIQRKAIEIQNLGPNPIYCTIDGTAPVVAKARRIDALGATAQPAWSIDAGPSIVVKCIAATAAQVTGAATIVSEVR
jgi:hypothetical protein